METVDVDLLGPDGSDRPALRGQMVRGELTGVVCNGCARRVCVSVCV